MRDGIVRIDTTFTRDGVVPLARTISCIVRGKTSKSKKPGKQGDASARDVRVASVSHAQSSLARDNNRRRSETEHTERDATTGTAVGCTVNFIRYRHIFHSVAFSLVSSSVTVARPVTTMREKPRRPLASQTF